MIEKESINIDGKYFDEHHIYYIYETETDELAFGIFDTVEEAYDRLVFWCNYNNLPKSYYKIVEEIYLTECYDHDEPCGLSVFPPYDSED